MSILGTFRKALEKSLEAIFPSNIYCIKCGSLIDGSRKYSICDNCIREINWISERTCDRCGKSLMDSYGGDICYDCLAYDHVFLRGYSCMTYGMYERELIFDFKYRGKSFLGYKFGEIMYDRMRAETLDADMILPVPLHKARKKERGYNQSALMAKRFGRLAEIPVYTNILLRNMDTESLRGLSPADRAKITANAFSVARKRKDMIQDKSILLIDDIYTTGATADACSKTLLEAGGKQIYVLTLAIGGNRRPGGT